MIELKNVIFPKGLIVVGAIILMAIDLYTGIQKSKSKGIATYSEGLRRTVKKGNLYFSFIITFFVVINLCYIAEESKKYTDIFFISLNGLIIGICYIEFKSICENLIETYSEKNDFIKYFIIPIHNIILLKLKREK